MAQLIDIILVSSVMGVAVWAVIKYFVDLGRAPKDGGPISCSGCSTSCHTDTLDYPLVNKND